jgi:SNF family Na+-dependent transporter
MFAPLESVIIFDLAYDAPLGLPFSDVVENLKIAHMCASECKIIISYLLQMCLFEFHVKADACMDELNQVVQKKLGHLWFPNHGMFVCKHGIIIIHIWSIKIRGAQWYDSLHEKY